MGLIQLACMAELKFAFTNFVAELLNGTCAPEREINRRSTWGEQENDTEQQLPPVLAFEESSAGELTGNYKRMSCLRLLNCWIFSGPPENSLGTI